MAEHEAKDFTTGGSRLDLSSHSGSYDPRWPAIVAYSQPGSLLHKQPQYAAFNMEYQSLTHFRSDVTWKFAMAAVSGLIRASTVNAGVFVFHSSLISDPSDLAKT
ncbi:hypothetical protein GTH01_13840 [Gluconobacter thailandicus F149-1 = NBRC 100600]|nr:hypothetical protein GTH01_13840 [Gluconobacter thailandicus F149-1 = NBRC 100600]